MEERRINVVVNGEPRSVDVEPRILLIHFLREVLGLTGSHLGCDTTNCGVCTVLMDGLPVKSCTIFAVMCDGHEIETVEGLGLPSELHPIQEGFREEHGLQCGFCTPGMIMSAKALLDENPKPTRDEIIHHMDGNICRCTGYVPIVAAIQRAAEVIAKESRK